MRKISILAVSGGLLTKSRALVLKHHIYQADALQLTSAKLSRADVFVSADKKLIDCAKSEGLESRNPERDLSPIEESFPNKTQ